MERCVEDSTKAIIPRLFRPTWQGNGIQINEMTKVLPPKSKHDVGEVVIEFIQRPPRELQDINPNDITRIAETFQVVS